MFNDIQVAQINVMLKLAYKIDNKARLFAYNCDQ